MIINDNSRFVIREMMAQGWLITGSARGLGRAIAEGVLAADDELPILAQFHSKRLSPT
jgi:NAD(P)-dependent dehydrogenase (short-subunit alcohol dehydrogenase family)